MTNALRGGGGGGGGGGPSACFGSEISAKSDFLGSTQDVGNFLGSLEKDQGIFGVC